jgi:multiple sugar transport system permease protein
MRRMRSSRPQASMATTSRRTGGGPGQAHSPGPAPAPRGGAWRRISPLKRSQWLFAYIILLPIIALYGYLRFIPIGRTFYMSFFNWDLIARQHPFVGLQNYADLLADPRFRDAITNTTIFAVVTVVISVMLSLGLAALLARGAALGGLYETLYFLPAITPMVPVTLAWRWILDYKYGVLNYLLSLVGIPAQPWLATEKLTMAAVILVTVWKVLGYNMMIFLVGIRGIPAVYFEAAAVDGANAWSQFWRITMPLLTPVTLFVTVMTTINSYNVFTQVYVLASDVQGAPGKLVRVLVYDIFENGFRFYKMGYASAEGVVLFLIVLVLTLIQFRGFKSPAA